MRLDTTGTHMPLALDLEKSNDHGYLRKQFIILNWFLSKGRTVKFNRMFIIIIIIIIIIL